MTDEVEHKVRPKLREPPCKVRKGLTYEIRKIGEDVTRRVKIMRRAGRKKGKYKYSYNVIEEGGNGEQKLSWVDLKDYEIEEIQENDEERNRNMARETGEANKDDVADEEEFDGGDCVS